MECSAQGTRVWQVFMRTSHCFPVRCAGQIQVHVSGVSSRQREDDRHGLDSQTVIFWEHVFPMRFGGHAHLKPPGWYKGEVRVNVQCGQK